MKMIFKTTDTDLIHFNGKECIIVKEMDVSEYDIDEVGRMYLVQIGNELIQAFADEIVQETKQ